METVRNLGGLVHAGTPLDSVAFFDCSISPEPRTFTHRDVDRLAGVVAADLKRRGLQRGEVVAVSGANSVAYLATYLGIMRAGLVAVPINPKLSAEAGDFVVRDAGAVLAFADEEGRRVFPVSLPVLAMPDTDPATTAERETIAPVEPAPGETAMILYTSGSTGRPKGVVLSHDGQLWFVRRRVGGGGHADERLMIAAPLHHMNGLGAAKFVLMGGCSAVMMPRFDVRKFIEAIGRFKATWLSGVPTMYAMLVREREAIAAADLSSVRSVRFGSAPCSQKLIDDLRAVLPGAQVVNNYGTTEAGPVVFGPHPEGLPRDPVDLGWLVPGVEARLIGETPGAPLQPGEGVLALRTPAMMSGYLNLPERTREALTSDGLFITGDVMSRDARGCYRFVGRADDRINCGGENFFPADIERVLERHPDIVEAAVIGLADELKGQIPVAFVVPRAGTQPTEAEIKAFALSHAPAVQHPRRVMLLEQMPWAGTAKIDRARLQAIAGDAGWSEQKSNI